MYITVKSFQPDITLLVGFEISCNVIKTLDALFRNDAQIFINVIEIIIGPLEELEQFICHLFRRKNKFHIPKFDLKWELFKYQYFIPTL